MLKREAEKTIKEIADTFRVLLVTGPRQVGKTTILKELMPKNMNYVTLDDKVLRESAKRDPKMFLEEHPWPLLIDEVQYAPELFPYIKIKVDESKERSMYWLIGSQQFKLMKNVTESLAGRVGIVKLNSLTYTEINNDVLSKELFDPDNFKKSDNIHVNKLFETIFKGGMPELYDIPKMNKRHFFNSYINTYLARDVKDQLDIKDTEEFKKFMVSIASRTGEQLNYSNISSELGITDKTVKKWLDVLVASGIVYLLEPYMSSKIKRITHMPKIIFMDTGLCSYLAGYDDAKVLQTSSNAGHYLETYVISELIKSYDARGIEINLTYFRDKEKNEIDLVMYKNNKLYPFEIKKTSSPTNSMINSFNILEKSSNKVEPGGLICFYDELIHLDDKNYIIPISSIINIKKAIEK